MTLFCFSVDKRDFLSSSAHIPTCQRVKYSCHETQPKYDRNPFFGMAGETAVTCTSMCFFPALN